MFGSLGKVFSSTKIKKRTFDPEKMSIEDISLPAVLKNLDVDTLKGIVSEEINTFKSLGYVNKIANQLKSPEYHSFQIGTLLKFIKEDVPYSISNIEKIIPSEVLYITKKQLHIKVFDIVYRFDTTISKDMIMQELFQEIKWTPMEVAYLLRYISLENKSIIRKN